MTWPVPTAQAILDFWIGSIGPAGWYSGTAEIDAQVTDHCAAAWAMARDGGLGLWLTDPLGTLAYLIVTDQAPRNMFRGQAQAFATDPLARAAAKMAVQRGWDRQIDPPQRQFLYLPFEHSENLIDQDRAVALFESAMPDPDLLLHARAHRQVIRRFGRFPGRNAALQRIDTPQEAEFQASGGYGAVVRTLRAQAG